MDLSAKDATILTLVSAQPSTSHFETLIEKADDPNTRKLAIKIREEAEHQHPGPSGHDAEIG